MNDTPPQQFPPPIANAKAISGQSPADADHQNIEMVPVNCLTPYANNARTHTNKQIRQIAKSIERFGFTNPVLIDDGGEIIAGHGRVAAAKLLGLAAVPTLRLSHLSAADKRAYIIADNRLAEKAGWDRELLAIELQALIDLNFEVELTGFETGEIDFLLHDADEAKGETAGPEDDVPEPQPDRIVSKLGDLWVLGKHRLLCGDARSMACYEQLLKVEKAELVIADPPYNVAIDGHVTGKGAIRHRDFVMASGEMSKEAFTEFLTTVFCCLVAHTTNGSIHMPLWIGATSRRSWPLVEKLTLNSRTSASGPRPMQAWGAFTAVNTSSSSCGSLVKALIRIMSSSASTDVTGAMFGTTPA